MNENLKNNSNLRENIELESKVLLSKLKIEISKNFWLKENEIENLIIDNSINSLEKLKLELQNQNKSYWNNEVKEIFEKLNEIKNLLEKISKKEISDLKKEVEEKIDINNFENSLEKYLPRKLLKVAKNPEKPHEHLIWASLWIANSTFATFETIAKIWIWIVKTPYDLYLLLSWKAELENIKKV